MGTYTLKNIERVIKNTTFSSNRIKLVFAKYSRESYAPLLRKISELGDQLFSEIILDKDELTLVFPYTIWEEKIKDELPALEIEDPVVAIMCEVTEPTVTGYLLAITEVLSPANVGVYVQGAFTTDHILVDYKDLDRALQLLNDMKSSQLTDYTIQ